MKQQLMHDVYTNEWLVEQEELTIKIIALKHEGHHWNGTNRIIIDYSNCKKIICNSTEEANAEFVKRTKTDFYQNPISWISLANETIIVKK